MRLVIYLGAVVPACAVLVRYVIWPGARPRCAAIPTGDGDNKAPRAKIMILPGAKDRTSVSRRGEDFLWAVMAFVDHYLCGTTV